MKLNTKEKREDFRGALIETRSLLYAATAGFSCQISSDNLMSHLFAQRKCIAFQAGKQAATQSRLRASSFTSNRCGWHEKDREMSEGKKEKNLTGRPTSQVYPCHLISFKQSCYQKSPGFAYRVPRPVRRFVVPRRFLLGMECFRIEHH